MKGVARGVDQIEWCKQGFEVFVQWQKSVSVTDVMTKFNVGAGSREEEKAENGQRTDGYL